MKTMVDLIITYRYQETGIKLKTFKRRKVTNLGYHMMLYTIHTNYATNFNIIIGKESALIFFNIFKYILQFVFISIHSPCWKI